MQRLVVGSRDSPVLKSGSLAPSVPVHYQPIDTPVCGSSSGPCQERGQTGRYNRVLRDLLTVLCSFKRRATEEASLSTERTRALWRKPLAQGSDNSDIGRPREKRFRK